MTSRVSCRAPAAGGDEVSQDPEQPLDPEHLEMLRRGVKGWNRCMILRYDSADQELHPERMP